MSNDKKNPKEASNIFHSIMKASVKVDIKPKTKRKVKDTFSQKEATDIKAILSTLHTLPREEQKTVREGLRSKFNFYISDFTSSKKGFTDKDFDNCITQGKIKIGA